MLGPARAVGANTEPARDLDTRRVVYAVLPDFVVAISLRLLLLRQRARLRWVLPLLLLLLLPRLVAVRTGGGLQALRQALWPRAYMTWVVLVLATRRPVRVL